MSYLTLTTGLQGDVPGVARKQAEAAVNRALGKIYDDRSWSFQTGYAGWLAGWALLNTGTYTVTPYSPIITADVTATQAANSLSGAPLLTTLQYRDPNRYFYSIVYADTNGQLAYVTVTYPGVGQTPGVYVLNGTVPSGQPGSGAQIAVVVNADGTVTLPPVVVNQGSGYLAGYPPQFTLAAGGTPAVLVSTLILQLTLDRPWMEPTSGPGQPYMIYQALFPAPFEDFRGFTAAWNTTDAWRVDFVSKSQLDLAREDPQRLVFDDPRYIVKFGADQRAGSSTFGWQLYELWPHVLNPIPVSFGYERRGPKLVNPTDCPPYPLTEELVRWRAKEELYDWAEANKGRFKELQGPNWQYLSGKAHAQYEEILAKVTAVDANLRTDLITRTGQDSNNPWGDPYSTRTGGMNVGGYYSE